MEIAIKRVTSWFVIIGVLSIINSVVWWFKLANLHFVVGLGITQFVDGLMFGLKESGTIGSSSMLIALLINCVISGFFMLAAVLTNNGFKIIYFVALVLYVFDALILLAVVDIMGVAFHVFALFFLFKGIKLLKLRDEYSENQQVQNESIVNEQVV